MDEPASRVIDTAPTDDPAHTDDTDLRPDRGSGAGRPWGTYAFIIVAMAMVLVVIVLHLSGAMGPGLHR